MSEASWHTAVIGSGIGGLACAAALARAGHRVLVLEQHQIAGGLTHTFSREGFTWNIGVHYLGAMGEGEPARAALDWLSGGRIEMAPVNAPYDIMHFPDGYEIPFAGPEAALRNTLEQKFPGSATEVGAFLEALASAERSVMALFRQRALPSAFARLYGAWHGREIKQWCSATTAEVLARLVREPRLRAVLAAQWPDYGCPPGQSSFAMHAIVMRNFLNGAYYPVGGGGAFAAALRPVIENAGGAVRTNAPVAELLLTAGRVSGVRLKSGERIAARYVVSDAGARNTVVRLLPSDMWYSRWAEEIAALEPALCHIGLYLGLEGDIRAAGAGPSNHWFHDNWDPEHGVWRLPGEPGTEPPVMMVSFPTLKDPHHQPGERMRHTAEVVALTSWEPFQHWEDTVHGHRPAEYEALKAVIERNLLRSFQRRFPALAPMIRYHEISTPLSMVAFTGARHGAMYGLETTPRRFLSHGLRARTPVPGLYFAGQDVATPGVTGAMMGGLMAAAAVAPGLYARLLW